MTTTTPSIRDRIAALDWAPMTKDLDSFGCTIVKSVLTREECRSLAALYQRDDIFRSTIVMARHVSAEASTNTGRIRCQRSLLACGALCIRRSPPWPIGGINR